MAADRPTVRLSGYDLDCGRAIDAAFAAFEGLDASQALATVFALVVHRHTAGFDDGSGNPLRIKGAGWAGFAGFQRSDGRSPEAGVARFATLDDGCRAAAVEWHSAEFRAVQAAYRSGDSVALASAVEVCGAGRSPDLSGLAAECAALMRAASGHRGLHGAIARLRSFAPRLSLSPERD